MLITRTPLRISIGGGGTDLPSYYEHHGAHVVSAAINKYIFVGINKTFVSDYFLKYSELERVDNIADIRHPIIRESLRLLDVRPGVEVVSMADIPAGTGLGSSGAFTVGLLKALYAFQREIVTARALAEQACRIEIDILHQPVGKQDQYIASYGGLTCFEIDHGGHVTATPLAIASSTLSEMEDHLLLFFTGYSRSAGHILEDQRRRSSDGDRSMEESLQFTDELGRKIRQALERGDLGDFADLMHQHWEFKRQRSKGMSNETIDGWYELGRRSGARGGKLVGAGAGGFLMFLAEDPPVLRRAMADAGLEEVRFHFDHDGCTVLSRG